MYKSILIVLFSFTLFSSCNTDSDVVKDAEPVKGKSLIDKTKQAQKDKRLKALPKDNKGMSNEAISQYSKYIVLSEDQKSKILEIANQYNFNTGNKDQNRLNLMAFRAKLHSEMLNKEQQMVMDARKGK